MATVDGWLDCDFVSNFEACDTFSDGLDGATELMANGDGNLLLGYGMVTGWREAEIWIRILLCMF